MLPMLPIETNVNKLPKLKPYFPSNSNSTNLRSSVGKHNVAPKLHDKSNQNPFPKILLTNLRSFGWNSAYKTTELEIVLKENYIDIGVFTETWASENSIESLHFDDFVMFHLLRKDCKRPSGGISIFVKKNIPATKLNLNVPNHIEALYVSLRPHWLPRSVSNILLCGVYFPGSGSQYAPNQDDIINHLIESIQGFYNKYSKPLIFLLGDFNDLNIVDICETCSLKQVVNVPTREKAVLDLILTNLDNELYRAPYSLPGIGKSDHLCVIYAPKNFTKPKVEKRVIMVRIFKESAMIEFGSWITRFNWILLYRISDVNEKVKYFSMITWLMIERCFPLTRFVLSSSDKEWITTKIKKLIELRQQAHNARLFELRDLYAKRVRDEIRKAKRNFNKNKAHLFHMSNPREWYKHVNKIIGCKNAKNNFVNIPDLAYKSIDDQIEVINKHFANICSKFPPINDKVELVTLDDEKNLRFVDVLFTYRLLKKYAKKSLGPGDLPQKILIEFAPELATPFCNIINSAIQANIFPDDYKKAEIIPIPKVSPARTLSDLRPISKTPIGGKMIEKVMGLDLDDDTKGKISNTQFGNCKGSSTTHYLIRLTDQAYKSTDKGHATTAITIDYSKAFDFVCHNVLIQKLIQIGVRSKLIKLIISFLSNRSHNTSIQGHKSQFAKITCGVPQGTVTGPKLFVILMNEDSCDFVSNYKFVDDKTLALSYTGNESETLQRALNLELNHTLQNNMTINESKCNVINFNFSKKKQIPQNLNLNGKMIQTVDKIKLLGVIITNDLTWTENTSYICSKVNKKLHVINKLKHFGLQSEELICAWKSILRPNTEYAVALWHSGLSSQDSNRIERLQKRVLAIIFGTVYIDFKRYYKINHHNLTYMEALHVTGLTTLRDRREVLTNNFALDMAKNENHNDLFPKYKHISTKTRNQCMINEILCKTNRYYKSAVPYMARVLNRVVLPNVNPKL